MISGEFHAYNHSHWNPINPVVHYYCCFTVSFKVRHYKIQNPGLLHAVKDEALLSRDIPRTPDTEANYISGHPKSGYSIRIAKHMYNASISRLLCFDIRIPKGASGHRSMLWNPETGVLLYNWVVLGQNSTEIIKHSVGKDKIQTFF